MSYPYPMPDFTVPAPAMMPSSRRPATVTVAVWFLFGAAASFGLLAVTFVYQLLHYAAWADIAAAKLHADPADVASAKSDATGGAVSALVLIGLLMLVLVASGVMCLRRMRTGQIMAYVLAVVTVLCCSGVVIASVATSSGSASGNTVDDVALNQAPAWPSVLAALSGLAAPLAITAFVLLLMPSARLFFRRIPLPPPGYMFMAPPPGSMFYPQVPTQPYPFDQSTSDWRPPSGPTDSSG